jgi:hypothetical protein
VRDRPDRLALAKVTCPRQHMWATTTCQVVPDLCPVVATVSPVQDLHLGVQLVRANPVIDTILGCFDDDLGPRAVKYRNHVYRGFNLHLGMSGLAESNELSLAWVAHDLGLRTARTLSYLAPSARLVEKLAPEFQVESSPGLRVMIEYHHCLRPRFGLGEGKGGLKGSAQGPQRTFPVRKLEWFDGVWTSRCHVEHGIAPASSRVVTPSLIARRLPFRGRRSRRAVTAAWAWEPPRPSPAGRGDRGSRRAMT